MPLPPQIRDRLRIPVFGAPMFLVSGPDLTIEQCKAGVIGSFPALNARPQEELDKWLTRIETELAQYQREHPGRKVAPHAVNLIMNKANKRLDADLEVVLDHKVPIVITSLSAPTALVPACMPTAAWCFTPLFSGVHGSYLAGSIRNAGLDPDNLPLHEAPGQYRSREDRPKTWKEIWGAGQGVGNIDDIPTVAELVDRLEAEYRVARRRLADGAA